MYNLEMLHLKICVFQVFFRQIILVIKKQVTRLRARVLNYVLPIINGFILPENQGRGD